MHFWAVSREPHRAAWRADTNDDMQPAAIHKPKRRRHVVSPLRRVSRDRQANFDG